MTDPVREQLLAEIQMQEHALEMCHQEWWPPDEQEVAMRRTRIERLRALARDLDE
jgi:hypothetical protein